MPCLVLTLKGSARRLATKGGKKQNTLYKEGPKRLRNAPLAYLVNQLLSEKTIRLPVVDGTGYAGNVDLDIRAPLSDLPALRRELRRYNLELVEAEREIDVLVLRDKTPPVPQ
ncbi:hypothetical protein GCM10028895_51210 [Pontibacter rugosus]